MKKKYENTCQGLNVPAFLALDDMTAINYLHEPVRPSAFPLGSSVSVSGVGRSSPVLERDFSTCGAYLVVRNSVRRVGIILLCSSVVLLIGGALYLSRRDKEEPLSPPQL